LEEAYPNVEDYRGLGVRALNRIVNNFRVYAICRRLELNNLLDIGGGYRLLGRVLRGYEITFFSNEQYVKPRILD
jgi:hypothetical protein